MVKFFQAVIRIHSTKRGFHIITNEIIKAIPELKQITVGMCQVFMQHTSASLTINEDASPEVLKDFEMYFNKAVPENDKDYRHDEEGPDDMPAHLKASILGAAVLIPIAKGSLALGQWQGIYLCEHRNGGKMRTLVITAWGEMDGR